MEGYRGDPGLRRRCLKCGHLTDQRTQLIGHSNSLTETRCRIMRRVAGGSPQAHR
jgi:hypothetical protein